MKLSLLLRQFYGLLWKNLLIKFHHYIAFLFELGIPIGLVLLISWACSKAFQETDNEALHKPGDRIPPTIDPLIDMKSSDLNISFFDITRYPRYLCYASKSNSVRSLIGEIENSASGIVKAHGFSSEEAVDYFLNSNSTIKGSRVFGCVIFEEISGFKNVSGRSFKYKIKSDEVQTISSWPLKFSPGPLPAPKTRQLHQFQYLINRAYLKKFSHFNKLPFVEDSTVVTHRIPYPSYIYSSSSRLLDVLPTFLVYCYIVIFAFFVNRVSTEKCNQSREMMKMCGLTDAVYWSSVIGFNFCFFALLSFMVLTLVKIPIFGGYSLWANSNFLLILLMLLLFSVQQMLIGMIVTVVCPKPSICTTVAVIIFVFSLSLASTIEVKYQQYVAPLERLRAISLLPNLALLLGTRLIAKFEGQTVGLTLQTFNEPVNEFNNLTFGHVLLSMFLSCIAYSFLLWYLDTVWPWQPGVPKPFYFLFTLEYWSPKRQLNKNNNNIPLIGKQVNPKSHYIEMSRSNRSLAIECSNLSKNFSSIFKAEKKLAVDDIDLAVYHGEITCLLGHNGAGKTTTMNMITGMFPPTSGNITVNGFDLLTNTYQARSSMCLCPQHDPLYTELTVNEHLYLYACIKGFPLSEIDKEIDNILMLTEMTEHREKFPRQLSGGMKRKLSLGIAMVGGSKILILDEPSSGLDTEARRNMWDTLKRIREHRTILLTTHDMEEADALGDRIIIMNEGTIRCAGTPIFLKQQLGAGYTLTVLRHSNFKAAETMNLICKYLPLARVKSDFGKEIVYELREDASNKSKLGDFFSELHDMKQQLGINSFGVSVSTLEDVFLKICDQEKAEEKSEQTNQETTTGSGSKEVEISLLDGKEKIVRKTGISLLNTQFYSLLIKRLLNTKRSLKMIVFQLLLPCCIFGLAFFITARMRNIKVRLTEVQLYSLSLYPETQVFIQSDGKNLSESFVSSLKIIVESQNHRSVDVDSKVNMSQYFISRMDGMLPSHYIKSTVLGFSVTTSHNESKRLIDTWVNIEGSHSFPLAIDLIGKAELLEMIRSNDSFANETNSGLQTYCQPGSDRKEIVHFINKIGSATWIVFVPFSVTFLAASYVIFPIAEKQSKAKLIQIMTGLHPLLLHFASLIYDGATNFICSCLLLGFIYLIDTTNLFVPDLIHAFALLSLLMVFGAVSIVLAYIFSFLFTDESKGFIVLNVIYLVSGIILGTIMYALQILSQLKLITMQTFDIIYAFGHITPIFTMTWGFKKMYDNNSADQLCKSLGTTRLDFLCLAIQNKIPLPSSSPLFKGDNADKIYDLFLPCCKSLCYNNVTNIDHCVHESPFGWSGNRIGPEITYMIITFIIYSTVLYLIETMGRPFNKWLDRNVFILDDQNNELDSDVKRENETVAQVIKDASTDQKALIVSQLYKRYGSVFAVRGLNFTVDKQECFGLLGVNGAGKSTTFGLLTGDLTPTRGEVIQEDITIDDDRRTYQQNIGYCPQFNPIIDTLSGLEMIYLFGRLRGVPEKSIAKLSDEMINLVDLKSHALRPSGTYSGGNKRKLSIALAMIGNPRLLLLDEPTAGVDPAARRKIWSTLSYIRQNFDSSMILTSHSMGECEALCSRMAIMVEGSFRCIGSAQHLKDRFGRGYTVTIKLKHDNALQASYLSTVDSTIDEFIKNQTKVDQHDTVLVYRVDRKEGTISQLFNAMEKIKNKLDLEDYTLSDTTLEQIFIQFARRNKSLAR